MQRLFRPPLRLRVVGEVGLTGGALQGPAQPRVQGPGSRVQGPAQPRPLPSSHGKAAEQPLVVEEAVEEAVEEVVEEVVDGSDESQNSDEENVFVSDAALARSQQRDRPRDRPVRQLLVGGGHRAAVSIRAYVCVHTSISS